MLKGLSEEQIAKVKSCKSQEEILKLAKEEGIELTDEQLEAVSDGSGYAASMVCPNCGSHNVDSYSFSSFSNSYVCSIANIIGETDKSEKAL